MNDHNRPLLEVLDDLPDLAADGIARPITAQK